VRMESASYLAGGGDALLTKDDVSGPSYRSS
jgi:hypothetical protein